MTEFKQIIGRGTRIHEDSRKLYFTLIDFRGATAPFADPDFDGEPVQIWEPGADDPVAPPDKLPPPQRRIPVFPFVKGLQNAFAQILRIRAHDKPPASIPLATGNPGPRKSSLFCYSQPAVISSIRVSSGQTEE
jgi:hypothetical protein